MSIILRLFMLAAAIALTACTSGDVATQTPGTGGTGTGVVVATAGAQLYQEHNCQLCHGAQGQGGSGPALNKTVSCPSCGSHDTLMAVINTTMPTIAPSMCDVDCADELATYILAELLGNGAGDPPVGGPPPSDPPANDPPANDPPVDPPPPDNIALGQQAYTMQCAVCHGAGGEGLIGPALNNLNDCPTCVDAPTLTAEIVATMPTGDPSLCDGDCAANTAAYILATFFSSQTASAGGSGSGLKTVALGAGASEAELAQAGTGTLLPPYVIETKLNTALDTDWPELMYSYQLMYGVFDAPEVDRESMVKGLVRSIVDRMASGLACDIAGNDLGRAPSQRQLFPHAEAVDGQMAMRDNVRHLYRTLLEREIDVSDPRIDAALARFDASGIDCEGSAGAVSGWAQVISDLVGSYDFLYE